MLLLPFDVCGDTLLVCWIDRKCAVTSLPSELRIVTFRESARYSFHFFGPVGDRDGSAQLDKDVDVIFDSANANRRASQPVRDSSEICMNLAAQSCIREHRLPVLRGEDRMNENLGQGLWHDGILTATVRNPYRVDNAAGNPTQGSRRRQPWAELRNPIGIHSSCRRAARSEIAIADRVTSERG